MKNIVRIFALALSMTSAVLPAAAVTYAYRFAGDFSGNVGDLNDPDHPVYQSYSEHLIFTGIGDGTVGAATLGDASLVVYGLSHLFVTRYDGQSASWTTQDWGSSFSFLSAPSLGAVGLGDLTTGQVMLGVAIQSAYTGGLFAETPFSSDLIADDDVLVSIDGGPPLVFNIDEAANGSFAVVVAVPEPASWGLMVIGFGLGGAALRRSRGMPRGLKAA